MWNIHVWLSGMTVDEQQIVHNRQGVALTTP